MKSKFLRFLLSLVIAFGIWLFVVSVVSPESEAVIQGVQVELDGEDVLKDLNYSYFFTCGPMPMFLAMEKIMTTSGQYSFEERMGCGFGACMGCSCKTKYGNKRICKDGPVLEREEIIW